MTHQPVLLKEAVDNLITKTEGAFYLDCTFGRGGHSREILSILGQSSKLVSIDKDKTAIEVAKSIVDTRFSYQKLAFKDLDKIKFDLPLIGVLFDLGVSSPRLDDASRGFSFNKDAPLDMRMDTDNPYSAYDFVNFESEKTITDTLFTFGEEKFSRRITRAILEARNIAPISTTLHLAKLVASTIPASKIEKGKNPATRTFQAIRIFVNNELEEITIALEKAYQRLEVGGRIAIITFHSLEDRLVKDFIKKKTISDLPPNIPINYEPKLKIIAKKITASESELAQNPRSRSAHLRVVEKLC